MLVHNSVGTTRAAAGLVGIALAAQRREHSQVTLEIVLRLRVRAVGKIGNGQVIILRDLVRKRAIWRRAAQGNVDLYALPGWKLAEGNVAMRHEYVDITERGSERIRYCSNQGAAAHRKVREKATTHRLFGFGDEGIQRPGPGVRQV